MCATYVIKKKAMSKTQTHIPTRQAAELEGKVHKSYLRGLERAGIELLDDPEDRRRKLVRVECLSLEARKAFFAGQAAEALQKAETTPGAQTVGTPQAYFEFICPSGTEQRLLVQAPPALPQRYHDFIAKWSAILGDLENGTWRRYIGHSLGELPIENRHDFIAAWAKQKGIGVSTIYQYLRLLKDINSDPSVPDNQKMAEFWRRILPRPRPGRSGHSFFCDPENTWMREKFLSLYLTQTKCSLTQAHQLLLAEIDAKQQVWGIGHQYQRPTLHHCRTLLKGLDLPTLTLGREGQKEFNDKCGRYISRDPDSLRANDLWVTDQKQVDVRLRDGGERLGRIWMVNFLDVSSDKVLGYSFGPSLNSDMVMQAATMALERYGVPRAVHMDLGKEFICKAFNGSPRKFSGETLYREAMGLWNALTVEIVKAIGENAQSKTIERWHAVLPAFDRDFPGYCGSSTETRPEQLATEEAQHAEWLKTGNGHSPLATISQYIRRYVDWAENAWNGQARGRGKMRRGMTPNEAYNAKRPAEGLRTVSPDELDRCSADHRFVKVARGAQVNLTFYGQTIEYEAPELFPLQGREVEVIVSRRTFRQVTVIYPVTGGIASCVASLKPQMEWLPENRDELRAALRCKAAVHRAVRDGLKAMCLQEKATNSVELLKMQSALPEREQATRQRLFGVPSPQLADPTDHPSIGSVAYTMARLGRRNKTASAIADRWMPRQRPTSEEAANEVWQVMQNQAKEE
jgi:hypothetical protein